MVKKHEAETLWQSKELNHNNEPFFSVKKARGYYVYGERLGVDSIAFILYDKNINKFCLINESKPPLDEVENKEVQLTTAFGGSVDSNLSHIRICQVETREEAGYEVPLDKSHPTGHTLVSTQMSQVCYTFLVDVTNIPKTKKAEYEEDNGEYKQNSVHWFSLEELVFNSDWKSIFISAQATYLKIIKE